MIEFWQPLVESWWTWIATVSLQAAILACVAALIDRVLSRCASPRWVWPELLSSLWMLVVLRLFLPPGLSSPLGILGAAIALPLSSQSSAATLPEASTLLPFVAFGVWLVGCLLLAMLNFWRYRRIRRHWLLGVCRAPAVLNELADRAAGKLGMRKRPALWLQESVSGPALVGFLRPVIVLPTHWIGQLSRQQLEHVLLHELAHVRRRDALGMLALLCVQNLFWFHPLVWLACRRLATLREISCDALATAASPDGAEAYRRTLLDCARWLLSPPPAAALSLLGERSQLLVRLAWLQRAPRPHSWRRAVLSLFVCSVLLAGALPRAAAGDAHSLDIFPKENRSHDVLRTRIEVSSTADELPAENQPGCLLLRYQVLGLLAQQQRAEG